MFSKHKIQIIKGFYVIFAIKISYDCVTTETPITIHVKYLKKVPWRVTLNDTSAIINHM